MTQALGIVWSFRQGRAASEMHHWNPGTRFVGLRISNIFEPKDYEAIPSFWSDPALRKWNLWSWVDSRDVAQACRLGLEAETSGVDNFTIAAADTLMKTSSRDLMSHAFSGVQVEASLGEFETLLSIEKARRILGYTPRNSWRYRHLRIADSDLMYGAPIKAAVHRRQSVR